ncbi:MAG: thioredoxin family protein [Polaromonas sp.]|nr:thioredoxin family protein [Polaromonas sp.]
MPLISPPETAPSIATDLPVNWVICLCADWCGLCRDYRLVFEEMAARYPASRFAWLDIEDQADLVGDIEVESFPTLLVADATGTRFMGPLTPHAQTLSRLLDSLAQPGAATPHLPSTQALLQALHAAPQHWIKPV